MVVTVFAIGCARKPASSTPSTRSRYVLSSANSRGNARRPLDNSSAGR